MNTLNRPDTEVVDLLRQARDADQVADRHVRQALEAFWRGHRAREQVRKALVRAPTD